MGQDTSGREAEVGTTRRVGDESDDQDRAGGQGHVENDGIPTAAKNRAMIARAK